MTTLYEWKNQFDDVVESEEGEWSQICNSCIDTIKIPKKMIANHGYGTCGVKGCQNDADTYVDFLVNVNEDYLPALQLCSTFETPFTQYASRNGQRFELVSEKDRATFDFAEVGPIYLIRFEDGYVIEAFQEEIVELWRELWDDFQNIEPDTHIFANTFWTPAEFENKNGMAFSVLGTKRRSLYDSEAIGTLYIVEFPDGTIIEAYPDEVLEAKQSKFRPRN